MDLQTALDGHREQVSSPSDAVESLYSFEGFRFWVDLERGRQSEIVIHVDYR